MSKIGYIRVSTEHQETARQQEIMCDYQVDRIFSEKISGANKDRPQLHAMLDYVREDIHILVRYLKVCVSVTCHVVGICCFGQRNSTELNNIADTKLCSGYDVLLCHFCDHGILHEERRRCEHRHLLHAHFRKPALCRSDDSQVL